MSFKNWLNESNKVKLVAQVEGNRWFVEFLDGEWKNQTGDYRLNSSTELYQGDIVTIDTNSRTLPPTVSYFCGVLTVK